jgi:hypothetical protein
VHGSQPLLEAVEWKNVISELIVGQRCVTM